MGAALGGLGLGACTLAVDLSFWAALGLTTAGYFGCYMLLRPGVEKKPALPSMEDTFARYQQELAGLAGLLPPMLGMQVRALCPAVTELQKQLRDCPPENYSQGLNLMACLDNVLSALHQYQALSHRLDGQQGEVAAGVSGVVETFASSVEAFNRGLVKADIQKLQTDLQFLQQSIKEFN